ncbi:hypothetical protein BJX70DRAFT_403885 [Aspergillus crustosus]
MISSSLVEEAANVQDTELFQWIVRYRGTAVSVTDALIENIARNESSGLSHMSFLLRHFREEMLRIVAQCGDQKLMALLLEHADWQNLITENVVQGAVRDHQYGLSVLQLLGSRLGDRMPVSENIDLFAAEQFNKDILEFVIARVESKIPTMHNLWYRQPNYGARVLLSILRSRDNIPVTRDMLEIAIKAGSAELLLLLLDRPECNDMVDVCTVESVARHSIAVVMHHLLDYLAGSLTIPKEITLAVATKVEHGVEMIEFLLDYFCDDLPPARDLIDAAATNSSCGLEVLQTLMNRFDPSLKSDEQSLTDMMSTSRIRMMEIAIPAREDDDPKLEVLVESMVKDGSAEDVRRLGQQVPITEAILAAAAGNREYGVEVMQVLFDRADKE